MYKIDAFGIHVPLKKVIHRNSEYDESGFDDLFNMQTDHFWYLGRHKFILNALIKFSPAAEISAIDLGGGCGGWVHYLKGAIPAKLKEIGLADSSYVALLNAKKIIGEDVQVYQADLMSLGWHEKWDVAFLLDVIEHCPDDVHILKEAAKSLKPGGMIYVTAPALDCFWSYNDDYAKHLRRYSKSKFLTLANESGLKLKDARYFMFFLSPLLWLSRKTKRLDDEKISLAIKREHEVPNPIVNWILTKIFNAETPIGHLIPFPWGTSIIGVFEKK